MDRFLNATQYEQQQAKEHARVIAFGMLVAAFAGAGIIGILQTGRYSWLVFGGSLLCGLTVWGLSYAVVYVIALPPEPGEWHETPEREVVDSPPVDNQVKHQFTAVFGGYLRLGNSLIAIPDDVGEATVKQVADARRKGYLETVSLRALDGIGISRFATNPPNAQSVMKFLNRAGAIDDNGEWTERGLIDFPSLSNGRMGENVPVSVEYTTTTSPGGARHHHAGGVSS